MWDVFISYARDDRGLAEPIKQRLESFGLSVFFDIDGAIDAGDAFPQRISDAIKDSHVVLAIWTPTSLSREWCRREAFQARQMGTLVPVALRQIGPTDLKEFIDASYENLTDFSGQDQHFGWSQTLAAVGRRLHRLASSSDENARLTSLATRLMKEAETTRPPFSYQHGDSLGLSAAGAIWERLRYSTDRDDLLRFAATFPGTVEAFEARRAAAGASLPSVTGRSVQEIWNELSNSDDVQDVQRFAETFLGVAEGLEARRRIPYLIERRKSYDALWVEIARVCPEPAHALVRNEQDLCHLGYVAESLSPSIEAFNNQWVGNPWSAELSWVSSRLKQSAFINYRRAQVWEQARAQLLQESGKSEEEREALRTGWVPPWEAPSVQDELIETLIRYRSEHGRLVGETLWPDEHVLQAWRGDLYKLGQGLALRIASMWSGSDWAVPPAEQQESEVREFFGRIQREVEEASKKQEALSLTSRWQERRRLALVLLTMLALSVSFVIVLYAPLTSLGTALTLLVGDLLVFGLVWLFFRPQALNIEDQYPWIQGMSSVVVLVPSIAAAAYAVWAASPYGWLAITVALIASMILLTIVAYYAWGLVAVILGSLWFLFFGAPSILMAWIVFQLFGLGVVVTLFFPLLLGSWAVAARVIDWDENPLLVCALSPLVAGALACLAGVFGIAGISWPSDLRLFE